MTTIHIIKAHLSKRGGKRPGAGRKRIFDGESTTISFCVPVKHAPEIKRKIKLLLEGYRK